MIRRLLSAVALAFCTGFAAFAPLASAAASDPADATPAMTAPPALAKILASDPVFAPCPDRAFLALIVKNGARKLSLTPVTLQSGLRVIVASNGLQCSCTNCDRKIFWQNGDTYVPVLEIEGYRLDVRPDGTAVSLSHQTARVSGRETYRWNGTRYALLQNELVLHNESSDSIVAAKPASRHVTFKSGASSALLDGNRLMDGFEDGFDFTAAQGQTVTLSVVRHDRHFGSFSVYDWRTSPVGKPERSTGTPIVATLPASGTYHIQVEGADDQFSTYALKLEIH
jgi:hypothetical protein